MSGHDKVVEDINNATLPSDNHEEKEDNATSNTDEEYGCEFVCGPFQSKRKRIPCLQAINNAKAALVFLCFALLMEGIINAGLFNAVISTIERRFHFRSTESGIIASGFDIFTCIALVVIALHGDKGNKALWFGWGTFIMGLGCVMYSIPHFTAPTYAYDKTNSTLCEGSEDSGKCSESSMRNYIYLFVIANGLIGLGSTPLFTMAITYLDENVKQTNSALYGGIYYSMGGLGPALGYLLGSGVLSIYTDIGKEVDITSSNSAWIGAWWIGFLVIGLSCIAASFFIMMFPKYFPGTARYRENRNAELYQNEKTNEAVKDEKLGQSWKDIPKVLLLLVRNLPYVTLTLSSCVNFAFVYGFNTFGAKYLESIFGVPTSLASLYFGIAAIFAAAGGQFFGGFIVTKMKLKVKGIIKFLIICSVVSLGCTFGFLLYCEQQAFSGGVMTSSIPGEELGESYHTCNPSCRCSTDVFEPVCGDDDVTYFSSCFAGCSEQLNDTHFGDCSCVENDTLLASGMGPMNANSNGARKEMCPSKDCTGLLAAFIIVLFFAFFSTLLTTTPNLQATLRCVPFHLRTQAVSLQRLMFTALGSVPGRIISGKVLDIACISWGTECGETGTCRAYNRGDASKYMFALLMSEKIFCFILLAITLLLYKPTAKEEKNNNNNDANKGQDDTKCVELESTPTHDDAKV